MKVPSAEMEKYWASALSNGVTKRGSLGPIGRGYLFEVHRTRTRPPDRTGPDRSDIRGAEASHQGSRIKDQDQGSDQGPWTKDVRPRTKDLGPRTKDHGPCFGTNGHPRRDTDVISRLSKSTIQDLSFYIGFTRIGSRIKHLGLKFGMNGHPRRAMDMILRLSKSTTENLSFYIGFGSLSRVKMVLL